MTESCWMKTSLPIIAVVLLTANVALADYGQGDSPEFALDLLIIPPVGTVSYSDSTGFSLNLLGVNRGWSDSSSFFIGDNPNPAPIPVTVESPIVAVPGVPFEVRVTLKNNGGPGDHGGISISFPELTDPDASMPPYESGVADVEVLPEPETTFATVGFFDVGDSIDIGGTMGPAEHLLVEGDEDAWDYAETHTLALTVTPYQLGDLTIRVRTWIAKQGTGYGPPVYRWPDQDGMDRELDQQQYWSQVIAVDVSYPNSVPGSVEWVGAASLHDAGLCGTGVKIGILGSDDPPESGLPWTGHPALQDNLLDGEPDQQIASDHETGAASIMVGVDPEATILPPISYAYLGIAPGSQLTSQEVTSSFPWDNIDNKMLALRDAGCLVINYSGGDDPNHPLAPEINRTIDDIVDADQVAIVCAAGNSSQLSTIACPANAYNVLAVGSLGAQENGGDRINGPWDTTSIENIPGPTTGNYAAGRCKPDLVAPGDCTVASTSAPYMNDGTGSSIAAPHVAGAASLLIEAARWAGAYFVEPGGRVDPRVIKTALLTGADKSVVTKPGVRPDPAWQTAGSTQPLDVHLGAGGLDALEAKQVLLSESTTDPQANTILRGTQYDTIAWQPGGSAVVTWPLGSFTEPAQLTATLVWNAHYDGVLLGIELNNLDLHLMRDAVEVTRSDSPIDNVEHIHLHLDQPGNYSLEIRYIDQQTDQVDPEPFAVSYRLVPDDFYIPIPGDMNCDTYVDQVDVPLFVEALLDPAAFDIAHPGCTSTQADTDGSGTPDGMDVQLFVDALLSS